MWHASEDVFIFFSNIGKQRCEWKKLKLQLLFDPMGFMPLFFDKSKGSYARNVDHVVKWDERLLQELSTKLNAWFAELLILSEIKVSRCVQLKKDIKCTKLQISILWFRSFSSLHKS